jgi:hypothetical protein
VTATWVEEAIADAVRAAGPLESWRMSSWDERDGYYEDGTVLRAEDVPVYRPPYLGPATPALDEAREEEFVRQWIALVAPRYRLEWVPIARLNPQRRDKPYERAWIELFVDLILRGSEPPPIICDLSPPSSMMNGSVRTHALRACGRERVHAWVALHG